jgi:tyrosyl-tRNA synthetase
MDQFHPEEKNREAIEEWKRIHNTKNRSIPDTIETVILDDSYFQDGSPMLIGTLAKLSFFSSVSEGKRLVQNGGLYINEEKLLDEKFIIEKSKEYIVRQGKKGKFIKIKT